MAGLQERLSDLEQRGIAVVAVSADGLADSQDLARRLGLTFPLLSDPDLVAARAFGVAMEGRDIAVPATFLVRPDGSIAYRYVGEDMADRPRLEAVLRTSP